MCSPELWRGLCCICCGTLTPGNTYANDLGEGRGGVHRGTCAIMAGFYPSADAEVMFVGIIRCMHSLPSLSVERKAVQRLYHMFVHLVATEDHYDMSGP